METECLNGVFALVVGDDPGLIANVLTYCGALVHEARSASSAVSAIDWVRPDIVVCDLPSRGAEEALRELRTRGRLGGVPALAVTGSPADGKPLVAAGFRRHVAKPFEPLALCTMVAEVVEDERGSALSN